MLRKKILSISLAGFIIASVLLGCGSSTVVPEGTEKGLNEAASGAEEIPEESKNAAAGFEAGEWRRYSPAISAEFGMEHDINSDALQQWPMQVNHMTITGGFKCSVMKLVLNAVIN